MVWMIIFAMCLMSSGVATEVSAKSQSMIQTKADFTVPEGWSEYEETIFGEPVLTLSRGLYTIQIHLFGGPGSRHETPANFLSSWEARDEKGQPAKELGQVLPGDRATLLYVRTFSMSGKDRDRPDRMALERSYREEFIIVPAGKSFFVLTFTPLEIMLRCSPAGLHFRTIPAGFNPLRQRLRGECPAGISNGVYCPGGTAASSKQFRRVRLEGVL